MEREKCANLGMSRSWSYGVETEPPPPTLRLLPLGTLGLSEPPKRRRVLYAHSAGTLVGEIPTPKRIHSRMLCDALGVALLGFSSALRDSGMFWHNSRAGWDTPGIQTKPCWIVKLGSMRV